MMASIGGKVVAPGQRLGETNPIRVRAPDPASIWNSCRKAATFCNQIGRELGRTKGRLGLRRGHYRSRKPKIVVACRSDLICKEPIDAAAQDHRF